VQIPQRTQKFRPSQVGTVDSDRCAARKKQRGETRSDLAARRPQRSSVGHQAHCVIAKLPNS
jgi:hypothetical protein